MNDNAWIWWLIGAIVVLAIIWFAMSAGRRSRMDRNRTRAQEIRDDSLDQEREMRAREAAAAESDAAARRAQAEADEQAARAEQLRVEAEQRGEHASAARGDYEERMREADRLDPDVQTDKHGNRIGEYAAGAGAAAAAGAAGAGARAGSSRDDLDRDRDLGRDREGALGDRDGDNVPNALDPNDGGASGGWGDRDDDEVRRDDRLDLDRDGRDDLGRDDRRI